MQCKGCSRVRKYKTEVTTIRKRNSSFTVASKRTKYLRIHLTKELKDLNTENNTTLMTEIEED